MTYPGDGDQVLPGYNTFGRAMFTYYADGVTPHVKTDPVMTTIVRMARRGPRSIGDAPGVIYDKGDNHCANELFGYVEVPELPLGGRHQVRPRLSGAASVSSSNSNDRS